jgi:hypothetical protein
MPLFFLHHVIDGVRLDDHDGHELDDFHAAKREAVLSVRAVQGNRLMAGLPLREGRVEVVDKSGRTLARVCYIEAVKSEADDQ